MGVNDERVRPRMRWWYGGGECRRRGHGVDISVYLCGRHWDVNRRDEAASFFRTKRCLVATVKVKGLECISEPTRRVM